MSRLEDHSMPVILDARALSSARKHATILATFRALGAGESFLLANDHDPKPLHSPFAAEMPGRFEWEHVERGPEVFCVRIGKPSPAAA